MNKGIHVGTWSPRLNFTGPLRRGRAWFSESIDTEYSVAVVQDRPKGEDRTTRWRGASVTHLQVNVTPSQILSIDLLAGYLMEPRTGLSALDPVSATIDRGGNQYFGSIKDQMYFGRGVLVEAGYAYTSGRTYEYPHGGTGIYVLTPEGRRGTYFVRTDQHSRRDQVLFNAFLPAFTAAGAHQVKTGVDMDFVEFRQNAFRTGFENRDRTGRVLNRTTFGGPDALSVRNRQLAAYAVAVS
jgi:hypothetical protein